MMAVVMQVRTGIAQEMIALCESFADENLRGQTGAPIIRPIWWTAEAGDEPALTADDEFLLRDDVLKHVALSCAPVRALIRTHGLESTLIISCNAAPRPVSAARVQNAGCAPD